jgi:hypothetical protein
LRPNPFDVFKDNLIKCIINYKLQPNSSQCLHGTNERTVDYYFPRAARVLSSIPIDSLVNMEMVETHLSGGLLKQTLCTTE